MPAISSKVAAPEISGRDSVVFAAFAAAVGLMVYPQVAGIEHFEPRRSQRGSGGEDGGYVARVGRWLKESF